jgi:hypothetical protein
MLHRGNERRVGVGARAISRSGDIRGDGGIGAPHLAAVLPVIEPVAHAESEFVGALPPGSRHKSVKSLC